jgi:NAD(P)H dehydrogenase (quinone)
MHAPPKSEYPVAQPSDLLKYDAILFGIPTRYGNFPAQWKAFWDQTGGIWMTAGFWGKYAGLFVSSGTLGGGQESTAIAAMSTLAHHGFSFLPLGYKPAFAQLANLNEIHGGSPWGAGTFVSVPFDSFWLFVWNICVLASKAILLTFLFQAGGDGSRQPTPLELEIAELQGKSFYERVSKVSFE